MKIKNFTHKDYMEASKSRLAESCALKDQFGVCVYSIYTIGVAFECFLRATRKEGLEFDDKHNLIKLYSNSHFPEKLSDREKSYFSSKLKSIADVWDNTLRYTSLDKLKKEIGHRLADSRKFLSRQDYKNFDAFMNKSYGCIFDYIKEFITEGEKKCMIK